MRTHIPDRFVQQKKTFKVSLIFKAYFFCALFFTWAEFNTCKAGEVSFFIPEGHEKAPLIDSLYNAFMQLDQMTKKMEQTLITNKTVLRKDFKAKLEYLDALVKRKLVNQAKFIKYLSIAKDCYNTKTAYFNELRSVVDDDNKANCVAMWRKARDDFAAATMMSLRYDTGE